MFLCVLLQASVVARASEPFHPWKGLFLPEAKTEKHQVRQIQYSIVLEQRYDNSHWKSDYIVSAIGHISFMEIIGSWHINATVQQEETARPNLTVIAE